MIRTGSRHHTECTVYGYEISPRGYLRPSALSRFAQQAAADHLTALSVSTQHHSWVVRRNVLRGWRGIGWVDQLRMVRRITAVGSCWLESCTEFFHQGEHLDASVRAFWVKLDRRTQRPVPLEPVFEELCRAEHGSTDLIWRSEAPARAWTYSAAERLTLREADYDALGHVNNSLYFDLVEQLTPDADEVLLEYDSPIDWHTTAAVLRTGEHDGARVFRVESTDTAQVFGHGIVRSAPGAAP